MSLAENYDGAFKFVKVMYKILPLSFFLDTLNNPVVRDRA